MCVTQVNNSKVFISRNPNYPMKRSDIEGDRFAGINWPIYEEGDQDYLQIGKSMVSEHDEI